jgi:hypothetical protein
MMAFAGYADFADCVAKNSDKTTPEAFCAWLEHQVTGLWPSQSQANMPTEALEVYRKAYSEYLGSSANWDKPATQSSRGAHDHGLTCLANEGWVESRIGWVKQYAAPKFRMVSGVRIFASGTWTDSGGQTREWTDSQLDDLVLAFNAGIPSIVPLKAGHTPDNFNQSIAEKLGVPVELITGDHGQGQTSLGRVATLERRGNHLMASFERVPEQIADLIEAGMYSTVSVEIEDNVGDFKSVLTAVALLGAEEPAVDEATLDRALVFGGKRENAHVLTFSSESDYLKQDFDTFYEKMSETIKGLRGAPVFRALLSNVRAMFDQLTKKRELQLQEPITKEVVMSKSLKEFSVAFQDGAGEELMAGLMAIAQALGLGEEATIEDILAAIGKLTQAPMPEAAKQAAFQKATTELQKANDRIATLEADKKVKDYLELTREFTAIPDITPHEIAVELAEIEGRDGKEKATTALNRFQKLHKMGEAATKVLGTSAKGQKTADFDEEVKKYQETNPSVAYVDAIKHVMKVRPDLRQARQKDDGE